MLENAAAPPPPAPDRAVISRHNGALSRGPVTPEGKARSALNATRHGLCARTPVLDDGEDGVAFADLRAALLARWQPMDAVEAHRVEELVFAAWREVRLRAVEDAVLARAAAGAPPDPCLPSFATLLRYRARIARDARAATEQLLALRRGRRELAEPAQLRWLAARIEQARAILAGGAAPAADRCGDCTNEFARGTNEPRHGLPPLAVPRGEPELLPGALRPGVAGPAPLHA